MWLTFRAHESSWMFIEDSGKLPDTRLKSFTAWLIRNCTLRSGHCHLGTVLYSLQHAFPSLFSSFHRPSETTLDKSLTEAAVAILLI